jgi:hypothetical protein
MDGSVDKMPLPRVNVAAKVKERPGSARRSYEDNQLWAKGYSDEIQRVRAQLREARQEASSRRGPRPDALGEFKDFSPSRSQRSPSRWERGGGGGRGSLGGRGDSLVHGKPRWSVPSRGLSDKERLTARESEFQHAFAARQPELGPDHAEQRERAKKEAALPWWEREKRPPVSPARGGQRRRAPYDPNRPLESTRDEYPDAVPGAKAPRAFDSAAVARDAPPDFGQLKGAELEAAMARACIDR